MEHGPTMFDIQSNDGSQAQEFLKSHRSERTQEIEVDQKVQYKSQESNQK